MMNPVEREAGRSALRNLALERKHSQELQNLPQLPQPASLAVVSTQIDYDVSICGWLFSGTCSAWRFLCQASSIHRFIVLSKLEHFQLLFLKKYFYFPIPSLYFLLGSALRITSICSVSLSTCHVQPAADSAHYILHIIVSSLNIRPFSLELISLNSMRH